MFVTEESKKKHENEYKMISYCSWMGHNCIWEIGNVGCRGKFNLYLYTMMNYLLITINDFKRSSDKNLIINCH